jgi:pimeloyl-ACP methyl ester carboxylesterase
VNGLSMYYEVHGSGPPLVLLHGGSATGVGSFEKQIPFFSARNTLIVPEQQGHGHTADLDRPLTYEQWTQDTAALLRLLDVGPADIIGWSDGGKVALQLAMRHAVLVRKVIASGADFRSSGMAPESVKWMSEATAATWPAWLRDGYARATPDGIEHFPTLMAKLKKMWLESEDWDPDDLRRIAAPVMIIGGDRDMQRVEHFVEMYRLIPNAELCVLPATGHATFLQRHEWLNPIMAAFLDKPIALAPPS